jgi:hypothetical protein
MPLGAKALALVTPSARAFLFILLCSKSVVLLVGYTADKVSLHLDMGPNPIWDPNWVHFYFFANTIGHVLQLRLATAQGGCRGVESGQAGDRPDLAL